MNKVIIFLSNNLFPHLMRDKFRKKISRPGFEPQTPGQ